MMKIDRKDLLKVLEPIKPALTSRGAIEEFSYLWFDGEYAYAANGGMGIRVKLKTSFKFGINGALFLGLLSQATADSLTFDEDGDEIVLKSGRSKTRLATRNLENKPWHYPVTPGVAMASLKLTKEVLAAIRRVLIIKPTNPQHVEHYGVVIYPRKGEIELFVTDGKELAFMPVAAAMEGEAEAVILPRGFAEQIVSKAIEGSELKIYEDYFVAEASPELTLYSNALDASELSDLPAILDTRAPPDEKGVDLPDGFREPLERALLMANGEPPAVLFHQSEKGLRLTGRYKFGALEELFEFKVKDVAKRTTTLLANRVLAVKDVEAFLLLSDSAAFYGADGFICITSAWYDPKDKKVVETADADAE